MITEGKYFLGLNILPTSIMAYSTARVTGPTTLARGDYTTQLNVAGLIISRYLRSCHHCKWRVTLEFLLCNLFMMVIQYLLVEA